MSHWVQSKTGRARGPVFLEVLLPADVLSCHAMSRSCLASSGRVLAEHPQPLFASTGQTWLLHIPAPGSRNLNAKLRRPRRQRADRLGPDRYLLHGSVCNALLSSQKDAFVCEWQHNKGNRLGLCSSLRCTRNSEAQSYNGSLEAPGHLHRLHPAGPHRIGHLDRKTLPFPCPAGVLGCILS